MNDIDYSKFSDKNAVYDHVRTMYHYVMQEGFGKGAAMRYAIMCFAHRLQNDDASALCEVFGQTSAFVTEVHKMLRLFEVQVKLGAPSPVVMHEDDET